MPSDSTPTTAQLRATSAAAPQVPAAALDLLSRLTAARVDFIVLGEPRTPLTVVPAPYARNLERLAKVRSSLGASSPNLAVHFELSERYQELLYDSLPRELDGGLKVEFAPEPELRVVRLADRARR